MTVYDCCAFLNENDLFEIRLNEHWDYVDKFVVIEAGETHTGLKKPLQFDHARFKPYESKIIYRSFDNFKDEIAKYPYLIDDAAKNSAGHNQASEDWIRGHFQGNYLAKILFDVGAADTDIAYASCLDELLKADTFVRAFDIFRNSSPQGDEVWPILRFRSYLYAYKFNLLHKNWTQHVAGLMTTVGNFKRYLPASIRTQGWMTHQPLDNAGWEFTFLDGGDGSLVLEKQRSWQHSKDVYPGRKTKFDHTTVEEALQRFWEDYPVQVVDIKDGTHPKYIVNNIDKLQNFLFKP